MQSEFEEIGKPKYKIFKSNDIELYKLSQKVLQGELVIFPTETVYGLGANALDTNAVDNIFKVIYKLHSWQVIALLNKDIIINHKFKRGLHSVKKMDVNEIQYLIKDSKSNEF